jgi:predicted ATPase/DNA-binding winged helix-turn-helix (wHTH) protein
LSLDDDMPETKAAQAGAGQPAGLSEPRFTEFGPFQLFPSQRRLSRGGATVPLGGRALDILIVLVGNAGKVVTKQELMAQVWQEVTVDESSLRSHIAALRRVLGDGTDGVRYIINVTGQGYCFVHPVTGHDRSRPVSPKGSDQSSGRPLPRRATSIIDREDDTNAITELLRRHRFVTVHGAGGIGKTTVALATADELLDTFGQQICFLDLGLLAPGDSVPDALASALGLVVRSPDPTSQVVAYLRGRRMLLVLDCCEHVIDVVAPLAEAILQEAPHVSILATSREPLMAEGEHIYALSPLDIPPDGVVLSADDMRRYSAASLFIERAYASGLRRPLNDLDAQVIADICRKVDGIALALELAAGRVSIHGLKGTASLLDGRLKLLWQGRRTAVARHRTLNATLDWSHDLASLDEQILLRRLSVFVGSFTLDEAQNVARGDDVDTIAVVEALARLVAKSLVHVDPDGEPTQYRLLDTTRAYARGKLTESGEETEVAKRHATYFKTWLEHELTGAAGRGRGPGAPGAIPLGNIRSALEWCASRPDETKLHIQLASYAAELFLDINLLTECRRCCERALSALDASMLATRDEMVLRALLGRALLLTDNTGGNTDTHFHRALEIAVALGDLSYRFRILNDLHIHYRRSAVFDRLIPVAEQAMAIADSLDDPVAAATASLMLGTSHHLVGNLASAQEALGGSMRQQVLPAQASSRLMDFQSKAQLIMARTLWLQGFPDRAVDTVREAERYKPAGALSTCQALILASDVFNFRGDWAILEDYLDRLIHHATDASLEPYQWFAMGYKGEIALRRGEVDTGLDVIREAIGRLQADRFELYLPWLRCALAEGLAVQGYWDQALDIVSGVIEAVQKGGGAYNLPELLRVHGELLAGAGNDTEAERRFRQSIVTASQQGALSWHLRTATSLARLWARHGRRSEARAMLEGVYANFTEGFGTEDLQAAKRLLETLVDHEDRQ